MKASRFPLRKIFGFSGLPVLSALSPILVLPALTAAVGVEGWASIAIGMSIGMASALVVNYGWGVLGPGEVAGASANERAAIYRSSLKMRLILIAAVAPFAFVLAVLLDRSSDPGAGLMALAMASAGLSPVWYFIGTSSPLQVALWDTAPRIIASVISLAALQVWRSTITYPVVLLIITMGASITIGLILSRSVAGEVPIERDRDRIRTAFKEQTSLVLSGALSSTYTSLSITLVSLVNFPAVPVFAAADRIRAMAKQGSMAVGNGFQGWVGEAKGNWFQQRKRMVIAFLVLSLVGLLMFLIVSIALPPFSQFLFGNQLRVDSATAIFAGCALLFTCMTISTSFHILAPLKQSKIIAVATAIGACVGAPAILGGAAWFGAAGGMAGLAAAEAVVLSIETIACWRLLRRTSRP